MSDAVSIQRRLHDVALDVQSEDVASARLGFSGRRRELDPTCLPATAGEDLRLDDDRAAELLGRHARLLWCARQPAVGDGNPSLSKQLLALILVQVHWLRAYLRRRGPVTQQM